MTEAFAPRQEGETPEQMARRHKADRQRQSFRARVSARAAAAQFRRREQERKASS